MTDVKKVCSFLFYLRNRLESYRSIDERNLATDLWRGVTPWRTAQLEIRYVKRVTMRLDLVRASLAEPALGAEFFWTSWNPRQCSQHAQTLHEAFRYDIDGAIFPTYGQYEACAHLIEASLSHYISVGTWLIGTTREPTPSERAVLRVGRPVCYVAGIQCVDLKERRAEIQNVSVHPSYRRHGLGRALVLRALVGLQRRGFRSVSLEATALNHSAVRLYTSLGFVPETIRYKEIFFDVSSYRA